MERRTTMLHKKCTMDARSRQPPLPDKETGREGARIVLCWAAQKQGEVERAICSFPTPWQLFYPRERGWDLARKTCVVFFFFF